MVERLSVNSTNSLGRNLSAAYNTNRQLGVMYGLSQSQARLAGVRPVAPAKAKAANAGRVRQKDLIREKGPLSFKTIAIFGQIGTISCIVLANFHPSL